MRLSSSIKKSRNEQAGALANLVADDKCSMEVAAFGSIGHPQAHENSRRIRTDKTGVCIIGTSCHHPVENIVSKFAN
ncbi:hypothetical protein Tco_0624427 [Tanacetum coccineum]|uniref:Uncharacterized protein n=1 Tax=Tanacetum coccineum TaxID=301880 RepID=A0ABQ4WDY5_9ASTR